MKPRTLVELGVLLLVAYTAVQVGPAVVLRARFTQEMTLAANSPIDVDARQIKRRLLDAAEGFGITLLADRLTVVRDIQTKKTVVNAEYQIFIHLFPAFTYAWNVHDQVEAYYY